MWSQTDPADTELLHLQPHRHPHKTPTIGLHILDQFNKVYIIITLFALHFNIIFQFIYKDRRFVCECLLGLRIRKVHRSQIFFWNRLLPLLFLIPWENIGKRILTKTQRRFFPVFFAIHHSRSVHYWQSKNYLLQKSSINKRRISKCTYISQLISTSKFAWYL